jgi:hypothetical protein
MFTGQTGLLTTLRPECGLLRQCATPVRFLGLANDLFGAQ